MDLDWWKCETPKSTHTHTPDTLKTHTKTHTQKTDCLPYVLRERAEMRLDGVVGVELRRLAHVEGAKGLGGEDGDDGVLEGVGEGELACGAGGVLHVELVGSLTGGARVLCVCVCVSGGVVCVD